MRRKKLFEQTNNIESTLNAKIEMLNGKIIRFAVINIEPKV